MPMYEFECQECRTRFEELVRSAAALPDLRCPACGSDEVQRQVSAASLGGGGSYTGGGSSAPSRSCGSSGFT